MNINPDDYDPRVLQMWKSMADDGVLEVFLKQCSDLKMYLHTMSMSGVTARPNSEYGGFVWCNSPQGFAFWEHYHESAGL